MRIGFLVWNQFQVAHAAEVAGHFDEPAFIFMDRSPEALDGFDPSWLVRYGAYCRFVSELGLEALDGQFDAIVSQFRPPLDKPWSKTRLIMQQYSLAKPKTAFNARWFSADHGLVYGPYSESVIGRMCPVSQVGNPRFDPFFEGRLDQEVLEAIRARLDPGKKTVVYLPTWGDLDTAGEFIAALEELKDEFNVVHRPHHLSAIRGASTEVGGVALGADGFPHILDPGPYLQEVADVVISDMSGAIFDSLYCGNPVILLGIEGMDLDAHKKADDSAIEVSQRARIGPYVTRPGELLRHVRELTSGNPYREENEALVREHFRQRGGGAALAAEAIRKAVETEPERPQLQIYAAPEFSTHLLKRAKTAAKKRKKQLRDARKQAKLEEQQDGGAQADSAARPGKMSMKALAKAGEFFAAGRKLEQWSTKPQRVKAESLYQAQSVSSAVRFSRHAWRRALASLFQGIYAPSSNAGAELLQSFGMLRSAALSCRKRGTEVSDDLSRKLASLGPMAGIMDLAMRNEVAEPAWQACVSPDGEVTGLQDAPADRVVELYLLASLTRDLKDEEQRPYRATQQRFSQALVSSLLGAGMWVYPRAQAGVDGATPVSGGSRPAFTWHTLDSGRKAHFHVKIGTLYGHFIVDSRGYSGWASIAGASLEELTRGVDAAEADRHWQALCRELVQGMKSKYSQGESDVPEVDGGYIFLPMQVANDTVARLADIDTLSLLQAMAEWAGRNGQTVVVKRHPMCRDERIDAALREATAAGRILVSEGNIHSLVAGARCVVTVNSGVGAEALLQLKPVITTGGSDYAAATARARSVDELYALLDAGAGPFLADDDIKKFLWTYTRNYMVRFDDESALRARISNLLAGAGHAVAAGTGPATIPEIDGTASIPFVAVGGASRFLRDDDRVAVGEQCDALLRELAEAGVRCWLDSGSLLGLVRHGRLNDWEKDIDLGIWAEDYERAREVCRQFGERRQLWYREKVWGDLPYALLLSSYPGTGCPTLPISLHVFFRMDDAAWSIQPFSLVESRAKYPRYVYRETNGENRARFSQKVSFVLKYPEYSGCIVVEKLGLCGRIGKALKQVERAGTLKEKLLLKAFMEVFQWKIPAYYFDELKPYSEQDPHIRIPTDVEGYLSERYGDWLVPVKNWFYIVDDGCISPIQRAELKARLVRAAEQLPASGGDGRQAIA